MIHKRKGAIRQQVLADPELGKMGQLPSGPCWLPKEPFWGLAKSLTFTDFQKFM